MLLVEWFLIKLSRLADYIESEPARLAAKAEAQKQKLANLERKLGIDPSSSSSKDPSAPPEVLAGKKHRFDDTEYLEKSHELKEGVKSAVSVALLKKKKKVKTSHSPDEVSPEAESKKDKGKANEEEKEAVDKVSAIKAALASAQPVQPTPAVALEAVGA